MKLPKRYHRFGVGKKIGDSVYIHKDYEYLLTNEGIKEYKAHLNKLFDGFEYTIIKYNIRTKAFSFIKCSEFDTEEEPVVGESMLVREDGSTRFIKQAKDPWIYHHKWLMVAPEYKGFDMKESVDRSLWWMDIPNLDKARIGKLSYWTENVTSKVSNNG